MLLAAEHNLNIKETLVDTSLPTRAAKIKHRAFAEALQASLQRTTSTTEIGGEVLTEQRRIVITSTTAIILECSLAITICLSVGTLWFTRQTKRPLGLSEDTAFANTIASLLSNSSEFRKHVQSLYYLRADTTTKTPPDPRFELKAGSLMLNTSLEPRQRASIESLSFSSPDPSRPWNLKTLSMYTIGALAASLVALMATLIGLYEYSEKSGLSGSAVLSQIVIGDVESPLGSISAYSVVPTLLTVLIGLWWGALKARFRTYQPFISTARQPEDSARGSGLSYQSSYLVWACIRAGYRYHLLLSFVCLGAVLSQIREFNHTLLSDSQLTLLQSNNHHLGFIQERALPP